MHRQPDALEDVVHQHSPSRRRRQSAHDADLVSPDLVSPDLVSPDLVSPAFAAAYTHSPNRLARETERIMDGVQVIRADIEPTIHTLYESSTGRFQYIVADPATKDAVIIDPVLDRNPYTPGINTTAADQILDLVREHQYHVVRILETHSLLEHPTSAWYLRTQLRDSNGQMPRICTGKAIAGVQRMFARQYGVRDAGWAARFDSFHDGQVFAVGEMKVRCIHLLSQPDWFAYMAGRHIFLGKEVPTHLTESTTARPMQQVTLRKLATYMHDYAFHPQATTATTATTITTNTTNGELSRPSTARTDVSEWMHEPVVPRASLSVRRMGDGQQQQHIEGRQSSTSSRASSLHSIRRDSPIPELA